MRQIVDALKYLHSRQVIHRDLKLENLLINFELEEDKRNLNMLKAQVKIIDFGFANHLDNSGLRYSVLGSPINMDPILLTKLITKNLTNLTGYNEKADIWSLGTVCYELIAGKPIFNAQSVIELVRLVEIGAYHIPTDLSEEIISFLTSMLQYSSQYRLTAEELSNHPFLIKNVYEFTKINLMNYTNRVDAKGIIFNIKKNPQIEKPTVDVQNKMNYYQHQQIYQNLTNNNNYNKSYSNAYNYYANTGPKYYMANINTNNKPINQYKLNTPPVPKLVNANSPNNMQNNINNNNNNFLKQAYTYQEKNYLQTKQINNIKNNNNNINPNNKYIKPNINQNFTNFTQYQNQNQTQTRIQKNYMKNGVANNSNKNINSNNLKKPENKNISKEINGFLTNKPSLEGKYESKKELTIQNNDNYNNYNGYNNNNYKHSFTQNKTKSYKEENKNQNYNNYTYNPTSNIQNNNNYQNKPIINAQNYNNFSNKSKINDLNYNNNININRPFSEGTYNEFNQNQIKVPILQDGINEINFSPTQISEEINTNNNITSEPVLNMYEENNNQDNLRKSRFYEDDANNNYANKSIPEFENRNVSKSEIKKEISSDVLDNLFNFNIGKELKPDADVGFLCWDNPIGFPAYAKSHGATAINPVCYNLNLPDTMEAKDKYGLKIYAWWVDKEEDIVMCVEKGVTAVITDNPAHVFEVYKKHGFIE